MLFFPNSFKCCAVKEDYIGINFAFVCHDIYCTGNDLSNNCSAKFIVTPKEAPRRSLFLQCQVVCCILQVIQLQVICNGCYPEKVFQSTVILGHFRTVVFKVYTSCGVWTLEYFSFLPVAARTLYTDVAGRGVGPGPPLKSQLQYVIES